MTDLNPEPRKPTVAFFPAHPAQVWMLDALAGQVGEWADVLWYLREKDVSREIADALGLRYRLLSIAGRSLTGNALELAANTGRVVRETLTNRINCWISKYGAANLGARLSGASTISFNDDDYDAVPWVAWTSYPFARRILAPDVTRMGPFERKVIRYRSFHELFYLHPNRFTPDRSVRSELKLGEEQSYVIIRLSALTAHHDMGVQGVSKELLSWLLFRLQPEYRVFISSEKPLSQDLERFRMPLAIDRIHHALAYATCVISDSQTMSAEAAVLGTPSFRVSDFVGRISYLDELERLGLTFGFKPGDVASLRERLDQLFAMSAKARANALAERRARLLREKTDPLPMFAGVIRDVIGITEKPNENPT